MSIPEELSSRLRAVWALVQSPHWCRDTYQQETKDWFHDNTKMLDGFTFGQLCAK